MLVSDSCKLAFVHIQKTGGSTVHRLLTENLPDMYVVGARHDFATRGVKELENWDEYFKFAFVRNPWERLVSWYSMMTKFRQRTKFRQSGNELWKYVRDNSSNFEEFIYNCTGEVEMREGVHYSFAYNQLDYVTDENGSLLVDFMGRLENFDDDVRHVFDRIGVEVEIVPHWNLSRHTHYSAFYTPETEEIVRERFKRDIDFFGYAFERVAQDQGAGSTKESLPNPQQEAEKKVDVRSNQKPGNRPPARPGLLFVCGCDRSGTTTFADYLNRHPELLVCQERFKATIPQEKITPNLFTFDRIQDFRPGEAENPIWKNGQEFFVEYHKRLLADKVPARLKWIGDKNPNYVRRLDLLAGNNPGARFVVMYRPIEEVAESWEARATDPDDHWNSKRGFERAVDTWNLALRKTRWFVENSLAPRVLVISYHDFFYQTDRVVPLISRFLGLELDESVTRAWTDKTLEFQKGRRPKQTLSQEQRAFIHEHADRSAEAWILDRIDKQWTDPGIYTQRKSEPALTRTMYEMEAKTWRLQRTMNKLEANLARRRQEVRELTSSRSWRLLNKINKLRTRVKGE